MVKLTLDKITSNHGFILEPNKNFQELFVEDAESPDHESQKNHDVIYFKNKNEMKSIFNNGEVLKLIVHPGVGDVIKNKYKTVSIKYNGYFKIDGMNYQRFDYSQDHDNLGLSLDEAIPGLEIAVSSMKKGEVAYFIISPKLAYGDLGCPPRIPPNAEVLFDIELLNYSNIDDKAGIFNAEAQNLFVKAAAVFKEKNFPKAIRLYKKVLSILDATPLFNDKEEIKMNKMLLKLMVNLMICYNCVNEPQKTCLIFYSLDSLPIKNGKAYYHHAKALLAMGQYEEALSNIHEAMKIYYPSSPNYVLLEKFANTIVEKKMDDPWVRSNK